MDGLFREPQFTQDILDHTTMVALKLYMPALCSATTGKLTFELGRHIVEIDILVKTRNNRCEPTPFASFNGDCYSRLFLCDGLADTEVFGETTIWTYSVFV